MTIMFDANGLPTVWAGDTCESITKTAVTLPFNLGIALTNGTVAPSVVQLQSTGSAALQL